MNVMKAKIALFYGMGGAAIEWWSNGERAFKPRLEALGAEVKLLNWNDRQDAYDFMRNFDGLRIYCGDSLGAGSAAQYPGDVKGIVHFAGGFQPSRYDARASWGYIPVAANVREAWAIYNPNWLQTVGLGNARYKSSGFEQIVKNIPHKAPHPDDWGWSQDQFYNRIKALLNGH